MAAVRQTFLRWIKERSSVRNKKGSVTSQDLQTTSESDDNADVADDNLNGVLSSSPHGSSVGRASMKLPPVPKYLDCRELKLRTHSDSPAHVYEEIPDNFIITSSNAENDTEYGFWKNGNQPCRKSQTQTHFVGGRGVPARQRTALCPPRHHIDEGTLSDIYPDEGCPSSGTFSDSLYKDSHQYSINNDRLNDQHNVHCNKCSRPHGFYNGTKYQHVDLDHEQAMKSVHIKINGLSLCEPKKAWDHHHHHQHQSNAAPASLSQHCHDNAASSPNSDNSMCSNFLDNANSSLTTSPGLSRGDSICYNTNITNMSISSYESSSSGVYAGSEKDDLLPPRPTRSILKKTNNKRHTESSGGESGNDTFSEYDLPSSESAVESTEEYCHFLQKASSNLKMKSDVLKIIRESESSDYDTVALGNGDADVSRLQCSSRVSHNQNNRSVRPKPKCRMGTRSIQSNRQSQSDSAANRSSTGQQARSHSKLKPSRGNAKGKHARRKQAECYEIPEAIKAENIEAVSEAESETQRLSCRATDFQLTHTPKKPGSGTPSTYGSLRTTGVLARTRGASTPASQNRLLGDLMKINQDRQLLMLF